MSLGRNVQFKLEWEAHEHEHKHRSADWFWAMGIIVFSLALVSIIFGNIILAILIVISAFALSLFLNREPDTVRVVINEKGITREDTRYPFSTLESFWIDIEHPHKKILLRSKKTFMPLIVIPLGDDVDPHRVHRILERILPEEFHALPLVERFLEYLGF